MAGMQRLSFLLQRGRAIARPMLQPANVEELNTRSVLIDGVGVGLVAGIGTFLSVFLVRLGASAFTVGLLTAMPALTGVLLALPVGRLLERQRNVVPWYSRSRVWVQGSYALTGLVPFIFPLSMAPIPIIAIWAIATVPQTVVNIAFTVVMGAVAGPHRRYYLMSRRWSIIGIVSAISVAVAGWALTMMPFPLNYQIVFIASFLGGMVSFAFSSRITIPDNDPAEIAEASTQTRGERMREWMTALRQNPAFSNFLISQFVFRFGITMALPLFPLYWVRVVNASDFSIGLINTVNSGVLMVAYFAWATASRRRGNMFVLRAASLGVAFYPMLVGSTQSTTLLIVFAGLAGFFSAGVDLVLFDILLSTAPKHHTATYIALYQMTTYVATLLAPLLGTLLAEQIGLTPTLYITSALRFAGVGLFVLLGVGALARERI